MLKGKWRGSTTVEAAIIMPIFLVLLITMLMFAMFVYEKAAMRSVCNHVAAEGAAIWQRGAEYMADYYANGGIPEQDRQGKVHIYHIYANYFSNLTELQKDPKIRMMESYLTKEIARHSFILKEGDVRVHADLDNIIIHKKLILNAEANYRLLFYSNTSKVSAECVISGQTEMIRTLDFAADLTDRYTEDFRQEYGEVIRKLQELIEKVLIEK